MESPLENPESRNEDQLMGKTPLHWWMLGAALMAIAGLFVLGGLIHPDDRGFGTHQKLGLPPCGMMEYAGIPCPGCGVTTSVTLATHGRFMDSFTNQPFGFTFAIAVALFCLWALVASMRGKDLGLIARGWRYRPVVQWSIGWMAVSWVYKIWITNVA